MKDRVRLIRKHFALTQEQFANKIHRTSGFISNVENGKSGLSDTTIALICSEFSVRDDWLRNGAEPMFLPEKDTEVVDKGLIGSRIRDVRMGKGLSQAEFGKRIGFHKNQVYNVENGKSIPSDEFLSAVSREFNVGSPPNRVHEIGKNPYGVRISGVSHSNYYESVTEGQLPTSQHHLPRKSVLFNMHKNPFHRPADATLVKARRLAF